MSKNTIKKFFDIEDSWQGKIYFFDTETTGLFKNTKDKDEMIEFAFLDYESNHSWSSRVKPVNKKTIDEHAYAAHKISYNSLLNEPTIIQLKDKWFNYINNNILIVYNKGIDVKAIESVRSLVWHHKDKHLKPEPLLIIDLYEPVRKLFSYIKQNYSSLITGIDERDRLSQSLSAVARYFGVQTSDIKTHSALDDSLLLKRLSIFLIPLIMTDKTVHEYVTELLELFT